jgi:ATP synthase protein I
MIEDYVHRIRRVVQGTLLILAICFIGWGFTPSSQFFAGLILGASMALLSAVLTAWKIHKVGEQALKYKGEKKRASLGMLTRFSMAILAAVIAVQYPQLFSLPGMIIGLMVPSILAYGDAMYLHIKQKTKGERGE